MRMNSEHGEPVKPAVQAGGAGAMHGAACVQAPPRGLFAARGASAPLAAPLLAQAAGGAGAQGVEPPHSKSPAPPPLLFPPPTLPPPRRRPFTLAASPLPVVGGGLGRRGRRRRRGRRERRRRSRGAGPLRWPAKGVKHRWRSNRLKGGKNIKKTSFLSMPPLSKGGKMFKNGP